MNANAVVVERHMSRAIMSSSHAFWSLGGFFGGTIGGMAIQNFGYLAHAIGVTLVALVIFAFCGQKRHRRQGAASSGASSIRFMPRSPTVYLVGLMALFSMIPEGAVLDWAALYLTQERGTDLATAGLAYGLLRRRDGVMRFLGRRCSQPLRCSEDTANIGFDRSCRHVGGGALAERLAGDRGICGDWHRYCQCRTDNFFRRRQSARHGLDHRHERRHHDGLFRHTSGAICYRLHSRAYRFHRVVSSPCRHFSSSSLAWAIWPTPPTSITTSQQE